VTKTEAEKEGAPFVGVRHGVGERVGILTLGERDPESEALSIEGKFEAV